MFNLHIFVTLTPELMVIIKKGKGANLKSRETKKTHLAYEVRMSFAVALMNL